MRSFFNHIRSLGVLFVILLFFFLINPFNLNMYFGYLLVALVIFKKSFLLKSIDKNFLLLLIASSIYGLFYSLDPKGGAQYVIIYALFPASFYLLGKYTYHRLNGNKERLFYFLFLLGGLYSFTPLVSVILNIIEGGFGQIDRSLPLFWSGQIVTATIMGSYYSLNMVIPALLVVKYGKTNWVFKTLALSIFLFSLACTLRIGSRTQLAVFLIVLIASLLFIIPRQSFKRNAITFFLFFLVAGFILTKVSFDLNQDWLSTFASRMEDGGGDDIASGGGRLVRWENSLENIVKKPLGWNLEDFGYSHNLWFDVLRVGGVISFFLYLIFSIKSFTIVKSAIFRNKQNLAFNNQLLAYFLAFNLVFMVEPIFEGIFEMFLIFCLFMGIVVMYRRDTPTNQKKKADSN